MPLIQWNRPRRELFSFVRLSPCLRENIGSGRKGNVRSFPLLDCISRPARRTSCNYKKEMNNPSFEGRDGAVKRLRALVDSEIKASQHKGYQAGFGWARDTASPRELLNIERSFDPCAGREKLPLFWIQRLLDPNGERGLNWDDLSEPFHSRSFNDLDYVEGFLVGALAAWRIMADEVITPF